MSSLAGAAANLNHSSDPQQTAPAALQYSVSNRLVKKPAAGCSGTGNEKSRGNSAALAVFGNDGLSSSGFKRAVKKLLGIHPPAAPLPVLQVGQGGGRLVQLTFDRVGRRKELPASEASVELVCFSFGFSHTTVWIFSWVP